MAKRMIETNITDEDIKIESTLRPLSFDNYIGQQKCKDNLKVYIKAAKMRGDSLDHVLFLFGYLIIASIDFGAGFFNAYSLLVGKKRILTVIIQRYLSPVWEITNVFTVF